MSRYVEVNGAPRHLWGWKPPYPHQEQIAASMHFGAGFSLKPQDKGFTLAPAFDNELIMPPVLNQGHIGSCTAHGWCEIDEAVRNIYRLAGRVEFTPMSYSRLFFYNGEREKILHVPLSEDSGATITDGAQFYTQFGCCPEAMFPYVNPEANYRTEPTQLCWDEAAKHKGLRTYALSDIDWIRASLTPQGARAYGFPVVFGFSVPSSFLKLNKDGQLHMPGPSESFIGGHCVVAFGFDDNHDNGDGTHGALRCRNSWGEGWGDAGNFWMPYGYFYQLLAMDAWTLHEEQP